MAAVDRTRGFRDAKFGLFVHWGAYSVAGVEASWPVMLGPELQTRFVDALHRLGMGAVEMPVREISLEEYEALPDRFDPTGFDAEEWVDLARDAGQRYVVMTTKHHDGFAMFDTDTTPYSVVHGPFGRDVTAELSAACDAGDIGFGAYFSAPDFHDAGYRDLTRPLPTNFLGEPERPEWSGFLDRMERQVTELCTRYGELFSLWWDIGFGSQWSVDRFHGLVRTLQPGCAINDRLGGLAPGISPELAADFLTPEQSVPRAIPRRSALGMPMDPTMIFAIIQRDDWEQVIESVAPMFQAHLSAPPDPSLPTAEDFLPWESCLTFGGQWAWSPQLTEFKSGDDIVRELVEIASRGGNLLMNVGPRPDGTIQPEFQTALRDVGRWLEHNGESIYGTTFGPVQGVDGMRTTATDQTIYLHLLEAPADGVVRLALPRPVRGARALESRAPVPVSADDELTVDVRAVGFTGPVTTIALDLEP